MSTLIQTATNPDQGTVKKVELILLMNWSGSSRDLYELVGLLFKSGGVCSGESTVGPTTIGEKM